MPLTILGIATTGVAAGLPLAAAVLVAAALAPTDPVLAADVQVGEPSTGEDAERRQPEDEVRFALTSEAGLNDGLAFPFVYAPIHLAGTAGAVSIGGLVEGVAVDVVFRLVVGVSTGVAVGWLLARVVFGRAGSPGLAETATGFVALAATLVSYGAAELLHGYGFVAVFITAVTLRSAERSHEYLKVLHDFADEIEQLLVVGLLVLLGGAAVHGLLGGFDALSVAVAVVCVFVVRPVSCRLALLGSRTLMLERRTIAFFGIRGIASFYYVAYAVTAADFPDVARIWSAVATTVLLSIVVHGVAAAPVMQRVDRYRAAQRLVRHRDHP